MEAFFSSASLHTNVTVLSQTAWPGFSRGYYLCTVVSNFIMQNFIVPCILNWSRGFGVQLLSLFSQGFVKYMFCGQANFHLVEVVTCM